MKANEPILLICHGFPPVRGIGGRRWAKFAKELARRGHPVHVIRQKVRPGHTPSLWVDDGQQPGIIHHPLARRYPAIMSKRPITTLADKVKYAICSRFLPLLTRGNWRDSAMLWKSPLQKLARHLIQEHSIRVVIVTGAPFSLLAYAVELKDEFPHLHLVSDLRDSWTWGEGYGYQGLQGNRLRHEKELELTVVLRSDRLISPHASVLEHLVKEYGVPPGKCITIAHAIDPDELDVPVGKALSKGFHIVYAGSLYASADIRVFFNILLKTFGKLRTERPEVFQLIRLDYYITGQSTQLFEALVSEAGMNGQIRFHDPVSPKELSSIIARSDLVLTFMPPDKKDVLPTKFHEVFYLKCPILHVGEPGIVSQYLLNKRMGATMQLEELAAELPRIITGERKIEVDQEAEHDAYLLAKVTDKLLREVLN